MSPETRWSLLLLAPLFTGGAPEAELLSQDLASVVLTALAPVRSRGGEVCLSVQTNILDGDGEVTRVIAGLARGAAHVAGVQLPLCPAGESDERRDALARRSGAEWRLALSLQALDAAHVEVSVELIAIDLGLWTPEPRREEAVLLFTGRARLDRAALALAEAPTEPAQVEWVREELAFQQEPVLALAACDLNDDHRPELVAVSESLAVISSAKRRGQLARFGFEGLAASDAPLRDPIGGVVCADLDHDGQEELAFGHSSLREGLLLTPRKSPDGLELVLARSLPGIPLAVDAEGALYLGKADEGRNRFGAKVLVFRGGNVTGLDLVTPFYQLVGGASGPLVLLDLDYRVERLDASRRETIGTSGVGLARSGSTLVRTSSAASERDILFVGEQAIATEGRIFATTTFGEGTKLEVYLAIRTPRGDRLIRLSRRGRP